MENRFTTEIAAVDIGGWESLTPEDLLRRSIQVNSLPPQQAAARAIKYGRSGGTQLYDEIGFRTLVASPAKGMVTLQTIQGMKLDRQAEEQKQFHPELEAILDQQIKLRHRPLDLPQVSNVRYQIQGQLINFFCTPVGGESEQEERWTFHLSTPPSLLNKWTEPRDVALLTTQQYRVDLPGVNWLPFNALVQAGWFKRMQEWQESLVQETRPGCFYSFLSHRWLTPVHPDPEGVQAQYAAWQIFAGLCEALRLAGSRGLTNPRLFSPMLGAEIGISGSDLAEAILVNVLRPALDENELQQALEEIAPLEELTRDFGISAAGADTGLEKLGQIIEGTPTLQDLLERIYLWYDYSCMPQSPRTPEEEQIFRQGLGNLNAIQILGRTAVILDDVEDYMTRAWCTLEALVADTWTQTLDLLVGSERGTAREGKVEHYFDTLLEDRPHIVWRAVLDTEVFGVQDMATCMQRLNLGLTDQRDLPFIYAGLRRLGAPLKIHVDDGEIITGVFPLPVVNEGQAVLWTIYSGRGVSDEGTRQVIGSLDWTEAHVLGQGWDPSSGDEARNVPAFVQLPLESRVSPEEEKPPGCHVAVVGSCEGEAILLSNYVLKHREVLQSSLEVELRSLSWLATDIAPIGHFMEGALRAEPVDAPVWVIVAISTRFTHCVVTNIISSLLTELGLLVIELSIDKPEDNLVYLGSYETSELAEVAEELSKNYGAVAIPAEGFPRHVGGLFRAHLLELLL